MNFNKIFKIPVLVNLHVVSAEWPEANVLAQALPCADVHKAFVIVTEPFL